jgi:hypothetical protein
VAAFATPSELASSLQQDLDTATATLALNRASAKIRTFAGDWSISQEVGAVATLDGSGEQSLWLPSLLVTAVASVVEDGFSLTVVTGFDWTSYGKLIRTGRCWTSKPRSVVVTFTHGYVAVPDDVKDVCLAVAGRLYRNPAGLRSKTVGGVSWTAAGAASEVGGDLTESEREALTPYRLATVA